MAYTTINKSTDHFNTITYTGNGSSGHAITGVGFQPDWTWIKNGTDVSSHNIYDVVRGLSGGKLKTNTSDNQSYNAQDLSVFGTDGFTVGSNNEVNGSGDNMYSWNWKAGNSAGSTNNDGNITSTVTVNTTAGFSIVKYSGTGYAQTVGHGLGAIPKLIIVKEYTSSGTSQWQVYHHSLGNTKRLEFSQDAVPSTTSAIWNDTTPTNQVFSIGTSGAVSESGANYVAYCFLEKTGYSKFGSYTGNGNADGTFIYTGFKPAFIIRKRTDNTGNWVMQDNKRPGYNRTDAQSQIPSNNNVFYANQNIAEYYQNEGDILSNGFKIRSTDTFGNASGGTYVYLAFGQSLVGSNNIPCTAR